MSKTPSILNSKTCEIEFSSEDDKNLISLVLSFVWLKTEKKVEVCWFEQNKIRLCHSENETHVDLVEVDDELSLVKNIQEKLNQKQAEIEDYKKKLDNASIEIEKFRKEASQKSNSTNTAVTPGDSDEMKEVSKKIIECPTPEPALYLETPTSTPVSLFCQTPKNTEQLANCDLDLTELTISNTPKEMLLTSVNSPTATSSHDDENNSASILRTSKKRKELDPESDISKSENTVRKAQKKDCIEITSDDEVDDGISDSTQNALNPCQSLLMKKGKKLRDILLNSSNSLSNVLTISNESKSEVMKAFVEMSTDPIKIIDEKSAKERIQQWKNQERQCENLQIAAESYNLIHLMSLIEVYEQLIKIGESLKNDSKNNVRNVKSWVIKFMCENLGISSKTEQRNRLGSDRLRYLFNEGITCEQLIQAGCRKCDFFVAQKNYDIFLEQFRFIQSIPSSNEPHSLKISNIDLDKLSIDT